MASADARCFGPRNRTVGSMISAYLDPASGSVLVGALAAGGAGIALAFRTALAKLGFGRNRPSAETPVFEGADASEEADTATW